MVETDDRPGRRQRAIMHVFHTRLSVRGRVGLYKDYKRFLYFGSEPKPKPKTQNTSPVSTERCGEKKYVGTGAPCRRSALSAKAGCQAW